ncbi:hypothetical protein MGYG_05028 [Nannizzia gypsea CBS 118893]|uniref:Myb-like domain-containing protein n=1 Tax=Arthroderma gypseum (strain ATCC MYA-4604 / CBS 118893) TaxID=535722 RepID=E4UY33_ARTGP|nr:hypothetical protein MGYG_05028 [Nannizzia gypsea CBS 118893]EFR02026.1 hypothetical protein MGYG_05028 [Nannizzia gypsea CBS 118893]
MASNRQFRRIGTSSNSLSHISLNEDVLIFNGSPYPVDMPYQLVGAQSETFYTSKSDTSSETNETQMKQQTMSSHCPLQHEEDHEKTNRDETGRLTQKDIGIWVKSWRNNHSNTSTPSRIMASVKSPTLHGSKNQPNAVPRTQSQREVSPTTMPIEQPPQTPPYENWQPTPALSASPGPGNGNACQSCEWQMTSGPDILPLTASTYPSSPWETNNDSYSNAFGFYCGPSSPFSSASSSIATPELPLTAKKPDPLATTESYMYFDGPDLDSSNEDYSRASSNADTDAGEQYTLNGGENEQAKRKACGSHCQRNDDRDAFLIKCKLAGMSYKEIKAKGKFTVAESTLRGRFRSLTKRKELRVRKPGWQDSDLKLLCEAVQRFAEPQSISVIGDELLPPKISWKQVGDYIWKKGGSYHFGNATCKKKWAELQRNHAYVQQASLNMAF